MQGILHGFAQFFSLFHEDFDNFIVGFVAVIPIRCRRLGAAYARVHIRNCIRSDFGVGLGFGFGFGFGVGFDVECGIHSGFVVGVGVGCAGGDQYCAAVDCRFALLV